MPEHQSRFLEMVESILERNKNPLTSTVELNPEVLSIFFVKLVRACSDIEYMARSALKPSAQNMEDFIARTDFLEDAIASQKAALTTLFTDLKFDRPTVDMLSQANIDDLKSGTRKLP